MPDIGTALRKALSEWDTEPPTTAAPAQPVPKAHFAVTNNVCRATFDCIKNNAGSTRKEVIAALTAQGYRAASTTTLIGQMLKQYHVRESGGGLFATSDQYVPLKGSKAWAKLQDSAQRKKVTIVSKRTGEVINPRPEPAPVVVVVPVEKEWEPNDVIAKLNVHQALALFKALRNILVG